jgi:hypothetical protein
MWQEKKQFCTRWAARRGAWRLDLIPQSSDWPGAEKRSARTLENSRGPGGSFANVQPDAFLRSGNSTRFRDPNPELLELAEYLNPNWAWLKAPSRLKKPLQCLFQVLHGTST